MGLRILGENGGATIAESSNDKPVRRYCDWLTLEQIIGRLLEQAPTKASANRMSPAGIS